MLFAMLMLLKGLRPYGLVFMTAFTNLDLIKCGYNFTLTFTLYRSLPDLVEICVCHTPLGLLPSKIQHTELI